MKIKTNFNYAFNKFVVSKNTDNDGVINTSCFNIIRNSMIFIGLGLVIVGSVMMIVGGGSWHSEWIPIPIVFYLSIPTLCVGLPLLYFGNYLPKYSQDIVLTTADICSECGTVLDMELNQCDLCNAERNPVDSEVTS